MCIENDCNIIARNLFRYGKLLSKKNVHKGEREIYQPIHVYYYYLVFFQEEKKVLCITHKGINNEYFKKKRFLLCEMFMQVALEFLFAQMLLMTLFLRHYALDNLAQLK